MNLDSKIPEGPLADKWDNHRFSSKLVNPANKRKYKIIVVGSGLAGGSAAATLGELGYNVDCFCYQDSPRRAHSIAAQGGINAAKIIKMMVIAFIVFFMIPLKAVTFVQEKPMSTVSLK
jgi:succinate dehydrogenase / fumarate reductase flavoprotein subunit